MTNNLIECGSCKKEYPKKEEECPHCGEENDWVHPTIQKFIDEKDSLDLGVGEYQYECGAEFIRFTSNIEGNDFMKPGAKAIGFFLIFLVIGWFRNIMSEWFGVPGLWINSIALAITFIPIVFFGGKGFFLLIKYFLSGGEEKSGMIDVEIRIKNNKLQFSSLLDQDLKPWEKLIAYFKRIHS